MRGQLRQRLRRKEKPLSRQRRRRVALLRNRYVGGIPSFDLYRPSTQALQEHTACLRDNSAFTCWMHLSDMTAYVVLTWCGLSKTLR